MKIIILFCAGIFFSSCATSRWKNKYMGKHLPFLQNKYSVPKEWEAIMPTSMYAGKSYKKLLRRDLKKGILALEKIYAMIPDSTHVGNLSIDSFYSNKNKITFIKGNNLKTVNVYFLE